MVCNQISEVSNIHSVSLILCGESRQLSVGGCRVALQGGFARPLRRPVSELSTSSFIEVYPYRRNDDVGGGFQLLLGARNGGDKLLGT